MGTSVTLDIRLEAASDFDFEKTADLARQSFGKDGPELSAVRFAWSYGRGYEKIVTASAFLDGAKIGQVAAIIKPMAINGQHQKTAELVDLFVSPEHRSLNAGSQLYKELRAAVADEKIDLVYAYANDNATVLNKRFFHMKETTILPFRIGLAPSALVPFSSSAITIHRDAEAIAKACAAYADAASGEIVWSQQALSKRLQSPIQSYLCASHEGLTILASPRIIRSVPILMICATWAEAGKTYDARSVRSLIAALCRASRRPFYFHAGWNDRTDLTPGLRIPPWRIEQKFTIQSNFLDSQREKISRFEVLDFDYA
jgi:GNAT superfamily N-acetyltransferase